MGAPVGPFRRRAGKGRNAEKKRRGARRGGARRRSGSGGARHFCRFTVERYRPARTRCDVRTAKRRELLLDGLMSSPAIGGKALFLRTKTHLYRIEK